MKKRSGFMTERTANIIVVLYFFIAGIITLNFLPNLVQNHLLGLAFLIAAVYGVIAIAKKEQYLF